MLLEDQKTSQSTSALYSGILRHRRFMPVKHTFRYRLTMLLLDLDFADAELTLPPIVGCGTKAIATFRRSDYVGYTGSTRSTTNALDLKIYVMDRVQAETNIVVDGKVLLLTHLRYWGFIMNPIAVFYCYNSAGSLVAVAIQVTNTPWREKILYIVKATADRRTTTARFAKNMHVSPFNPMSMYYLCRFQPPSDKLLLHLENHLSSTTDPVRHTDATMLFEKHPMTRSGLIRLVLRQPAMTMKVAVGIYWQALKLWIKRTPVYDHPATVSAQRPLISKADRHRTH